MPVQTMKIEALPIGTKEERSEAYNYVRQAQKSYNMCFNIAISAYYSAIRTGATKEELKDLRCKLSRICKASDPDYSLYPLDVWHQLVQKTITKSVTKKVKGVEKTISVKEPAFDENGDPVMVDYGIWQPTGLSCVGYLSKEIPAIFKTYYSDIVYGRMSLPTRKIDGTFPVDARKEDKNSGGYTFYHNYDSLTELKEHVDKNDSEIYLSLPNNKNFRVFTQGNNHYRQIATTIYKLISHEYKYCSSKMKIDPKTNRVILFCTYEFPENDHSLKEENVLGVDLGIAIPAYCCMNNDDKVNVPIMSAEEFFRVRKQLKAERSRLQKQLRTCTSGKGREKKLKHLDVLSVREHNFATTMNHNIAAKVIQTAVKNRCKYINMEDLTNITKHNEKLLGSWSYFQLQSFIEQGAAREGITVRYINPAMTSQTCNVCGEVGERRFQDKFYCTNPACKHYELKERHKIITITGKNGETSKTAVLDKHYVDENGEFHFYVNADRNAAKNIACSLSSAAKKSRIKKQEEKEQKNSKGKTDLAEAV